MRAILYSFRRIKKDGVFSAPSECICATAARPSSSFPAALPRANRQILAALERRADIAVEELTDAGIRVLANESLVVDNRLLVVGRNDDTDKNRPSTAKLLENQNTELPVLLMDHRPTGIEEHAKLPVDVQVSGHVHNGQVAPANLIVRLLNRVHYGYEQINNGHFFVTSGYGFWGVPLRLGSQSEVWIIEVKGK